MNVDTTIIGWRDEGGNAYCPDCAPASIRHDDEADSIFHSEEADTPTHCSQCERLIPHALTEDGYQYVAEALTEWLGRRSGRLEIVHRWWTQYGGGLQDSELRYIIDDALSA